jgi:hypothetical protein
MTRATVGTLATLGLLTETAECRCVRCRMQKAKVRR